MREELLAQITLCRIPYLGPRNLRQLVSYAGSALKVLNMSKGKLKAVPGIGAKLAMQLQNRDQADAQAKTILKHCQQLGVKTVFFTSDQYPANLRSLADSPPLLYYKGHTAWTGNKTLAIIGTRHMSEYGVQTIDRVLNVVKKYQPLVLSGLAYGIDVCAHKQALHYGLVTAAVLGHGLDRVYPPVHGSVAGKMIQEGALISELIPGTVPDTYQFPKRNRIIAGMADVVLVVEARGEGGASITAKQAYHYGRPVFAVPGTMHSNSSAGCHQLIKEGVAQLLAQPEELLPYLKSVVTGDHLKQSIPDLSIPQQKLVQILQEYHQGIHIDQLSRVSGIPLNKVATLLLELEFKNVVKPLPGKKFLLLTK